MKHLIKLFLIGILAFAGCQIQNTNTPTPDPTVTVPPSPPPAPPVPPPAPPVPTTDCEKAQARLSELCLADAKTNQYCCEVVAPTKKGKQFSQFCDEEQAKGVSVNPECLATITNCDDIDSCTKSN
jgi:hypothetical protein